MLDEISRLSNEVYQFVISLFGQRDFQMLVGAGFVIALLFWFFDEVDK